MEKKIKKWHVALIAFAIGATVSFIICKTELQLISKANNFKYECLENALNYIDNSEALFDKINREDDNFMDTWGETDNYYDTRIYKQKLDSLINSQL